MTGKPPRSAAYWRKHQEQKCQCGGYHFPHRKGGGACHHGTRADYYAAVRAGLPTAECLALLSAADLERMFPLADNPTD